MKIGNRVKIHKTFIGDIHQKKIFEGGEGTVKEIEETSNGIVYYIKLDKKFLFADQYHDEIRIFSTNENISLISPLPGYCSECNNKTILKQLFTSCYEYCEHCKK